MQYPAFNTLPVISGHGVAKKTQKVQTANKIKKFLWLANNSQPMSPQLKRGCEDIRGGTTNLFFYPFWTHLSLTPLCELFCNCKHRSILWEINTIIHFTCWDICCESCWACFCTSLQRCFRGSWSDLVESNLCLTLFFSSLSRSNSSRRSSYSWKVKDWAEPHQKQVKDNCTMP